MADQANPAEGQGQDTFVPKLLDAEQLGELIGAPDEEIAAFGPEYLEEVQKAREAGWKPEAAAAAEGDEGASDGAATGEAGGDQTDEGRGSPVAGGDQGQQTDGRRGVPVDALREERSRRRAAEQESAEQLRKLQEQIDRQNAVIFNLLRDQNAKAQANGQAPAKPADPAAEIEGQLDALATKYNDGDLDFVEYNRESRKLNMELAKLQLQAQQTQHQPQPQGPTESLALQAETQRLGDANPWVDRLAAESPEDFAYLRDRAEREVRSQGYDPRTEFGLLAMRQRFVEIGKRLGLAGEQPGNPSTSNTQPSLDQRSGAANSAAKLALANNAPPDPTRMPRTAEIPPDQITEADLANMSDEDIAALPASVKKRLAEAVGAI